MFRASESTGKKKMLKLTLQLIIKLNGAMSSTAGDTYSKGLTAYSLLGNRK